MTLQTYDFETVGGVSDLIRNREGDGYWVRTSDAESALAEKGAEIERLRKALEKIAEGISEHEYLVMMAREALEPQQ